MCSRVCAGVSVGACATRATTSRLQAPQRPGQSAPPAPARCRPTRTENQRGKNQPINFRGCPIVQPRKIKKLIFYGRRLRKRKAPKSNRKMGCGTYRSSSRRRSRWWVGGRGGGVGLGGGGGSSALLRGPFLRSAKPKKNGGSRVGQPGGSRAAFGGNLWGKLGQPKTV